MNPRSVFEVSRNFGGSELSLGADDDKLFRLHLVVIDIFDRRRVGLDDIS